MTNLEKIQNWIESDITILAYHISQFDENNFIVSLQFREGSEYNSGTYDFHIDENDTITFESHLRA